MSDIIEKASDTAIKLTKSQSQVLEIKTILSQKDTLLRQLQAVNNSLNYVEYCLDEAKKLGIKV